MKKLILILLLICQPFLFCNSQNYIERKDRQCVTQTRNINGIESVVHVSEHFGYPAEYKLNGKQQSPPPVYSDLKGPRQMCQVTINYNPANNSHAIFLNSGDYFISALWLNGPVTLSVPAGYYDLVCEDDQEFQLYKLIFAQLHVYQDMDTTLSVSSANHDVTIDIHNLNDEVIYQGTSLKSGFHFGYIIQFPGRCIQDHIGLVESGIAMNHIFMNDITDSVTVYLGRQGYIRSADNKYTLYVVNYPPLKKLTQDTLMYNTPDDLHWFPHTFKHTPAAENYYYAWGFGTLINSSVSGYSDSFVGAVGDNTTWTYEYDTVDYYITHGFRDSVFGIFATFLMSQEALPDVSMSQVLGATSYVDENDDLVLTCMNTYPRVKGDNSFQPGDLVKFGNGSPHNVTYSYTPPQSNFIHLSTHYEGFLNESRYVDNKESHYEVWHDGELLTDGMMQGFQINEGFPFSGEFDVVEYDSNYILFGQPGCLKTTLHIDNSKTDPDPPSTVSLKVLSDDSIVQEVPNGSQSSVIFTAADFSYDDLGRCLYHDMENVEVYIKDFDGDYWQMPIAVPITAELDSLAGMPYYVDLTDILSIYPDSTMIDIRIILHDSTGNFMQQDIHPAFMVRDIITGLNDKSGERISVFPNPASDIINIETLSENISFTIMTMDGRVVMTGDEKKVDISSLKTGTYLICVRDGEGMMVRKVVICR